MRNQLISLFLLFPLLSIAQQDSTEVFDYSTFGDAQGVKRYCNQKVLNQTPQRIVSLGMEQLGGFDVPGLPVSAMLPAMQDFTANNMRTLKAQVNIPVISTNKIIWQLGANYWGSRIDITNPGTNQIAKQLATQTLTSAGINTTIFKPLNERNFLIIQASADINGIFRDFNDINSKSLTVSGTAIYGWKLSEKNMIGTGLARTYRAGQIMHLPVVLWNKTFNDKWGMELLLPARGYLRYNFSTASIVQMGFELEGNQFWMGLSNSTNGAIFIQRGELKPRIMWDKKLTGFLWFNAQAGLRYNWRFDGMDVYNGKALNQRYFTSALGNPLYVGFSLNFVSP
ncbi:MAG: hypothetical protein EB101_07585 [Chitinophagia bacterium]|nr:hypothetical protein [Chitinophagia bacterium]